MRILFVTPRFPYPPLKGDSLRVYHQLRALAQHHNITLLTLAETPVTREEYAKVAPLCNEIHIVPLTRWESALNVATGILSQTPLQVHYYASAKLRAKLQTLLAAKKFDLVHAVLVRMAPYVWSVSDVPVVIDLIDSQTLNLADRRMQTRGITRLAYDLEYRRMRKYERRVGEHFSALTVTSQADRDALEAPHAAVLPNGVDVERFAFAGQEQRERATLIFTGNMGYHPNEEAMLWFVSSVWPLLRARIADVRLQIVGTRPSSKVRSLAGGGVDVVGHVPDVVPYLHRATAAVCPMRSGSGIQNKVLEALATGAPVVASSVANRGVHAQPERDLLVADEPEAMTAAIARLVEDARLRASLARSGRAFVEDRYRWERHAQQLAAMYSTISKCEPLGPKSPIASHPIPLAQ